MTKTYPFEWLDDSGVITTKVRINGKDDFDFLLDTGSSDTYLDKNIILIENISLKKAIEQVEIETANGRAIADVFEIDTLSVFGNDFQNPTILVIDFIANGIFSNYAGILGMDILSQTNFCINFEAKTLTFN
jgi:predicted aspartyl protease